MGGVSGCVTGGEVLGSGRKEPSLSEAQIAVREQSGAFAPASVAPVAVVAGYLQEHLGQQLTAFLSGVSDPKTVGRWAGGKIQPPFAREVRLRSAYDAARLIVEQAGEDTARAWFLGTSPYLDHTAPSVVLHDAKTPAECRHIVPAAISFLEGAY